MRYNNLLLCLSYAVIKGTHFFFFACKSHFHEQSFSSAYSTESHKVNANFLTVNEHGGAVSEETS